MHLDTFLDILPSSLPAAIAAVLVVIAGSLLAALTALVVLRLLDSLARYSKRSNASSDSPALRAATDNSEQIVEAEELAPATGRIADTDAPRPGITVTPQQTLDTHRAERIHATSRVAEPVETASTVGRVGVQPATIDSVNTGTSGRVPTPPLTAKSNSALPINLERSFDQNRGVPGFLYVARNDLHLPGLFKLGQTKRTGGERIQELSDSLRRAGEIGQFELVCEVPTGDAFGMEQLAFEWLRDCRAIDQREFFFGDPRLFLAAFKGVTRLERKEDFLAAWRTPLAEACASRDAVERMVGELIPPKVGPGSGWVYLTRNDYHLVDVFGIGCSATDPLEGIARRNRLRQQKSGCIGFSRIVHCVSTYQPHQVTHRVLSWFRRQRVHPRQRFVRARLSDLSEALGALAVLAHSEKQNADVASNKSERQTSPQSTGREQPGGGTRDQPAPDQNGTTESPVLQNHCPHPNCLAEIRTSGQEDSVRSLRCPSCRRLVEYFVENGKLCVRRPYL